MNLLLLISLIAGPVFLCVLFRRRLEEAMTPYFCALMLVLYCLAIFRGLPLMNVAAPLASVLLVVLCAVRMVRSGFGRSLKQAAGLIFTPGMLGFALAAAALIFFSRDHVVHSTDDIYYWGIEAHAIYAHGGLVGAARHIAPRFMTYTPGMQLWQWLGLEVMGEWNEGSLYAVLWLSYLVFLAPLTRSLTLRKAYWLPLAVLLMICVPTLMNVDAYDMLRVDTALGLCMGYALVQAWRLWRAEKGAKWEMACFGLALCALVLLKQIGVAWAAMAMAFVWLVWRPQEGMKRWHLAAACAAPAVAFVSWKAVCSVLKLSGIHLSNASGHLGRMLDGTWQLPAWTKDLPAALWQALTADTAGGMPMLGWLALLIAVVWLITERSDRRGAVRGWCLGAAVLFVIAYAVILVVSIFSDGAESLMDAAFMSMLTQRYGCPLTMGLFLLCSICLVESSGKWTVQRKALAGVMLVVVLCCTRWGSMYANFHPNVYAEENGELVYETELAENFWLDEMEDVENAVVLYVTEHPPYIAERLQYVAAPHKIVVAPTYDVSEAEFLRLLEDYGITHIICMDDMTSVYSHAVACTEDEWLDVWSVYTVTCEDGQWLISY